MLLKKIKKIKMNCPRDYERNGTEPYPYHTTYGVKFNMRLGLRVSYSATFAL